jgi:hypothetical protein
MKKLLLIFVSFFILISFPLFFKPILIKLFTGTARVIGREAKSEIYINGKKELEAKLFISKSNFEGNETRDYLILYLRNVKDYDTLPVFIIDKKYQNVMIPNASKADYDIIFKNLFQSDSGSNVMVSLKDNIKGLGFDPDLKIGKDVIQFKILVDGKYSKITVKIE